MGVDTKDETRIRSRPGQGVHWTLYRRGVRAWSTLRPLTCKIEHFVCLAWRSDSVMGAFVESLTMSVYNLWD